MASRLSFDLAVETDRLLLEQFKYLQLAHSQLVEIRASSRKTIDESRALMARIDGELALRW